MQRYSYGYGSVKDSEKKSLILVFKPSEEESSMFSVFEEGQGQPEFNLQVATYNMHNVKRVDPSELAPNIEWEKLY